MNPGGKIQNAACFAEKIRSAALRKFVYVSVLWIFFPEITLGDGPENSRIRVKSELLVGKI